MASVGERSNRLRAEFLRIDSETAMIFCGIALEATDLEKRERTIRAARKAYDTILRLRPSVVLTQEEADRLERNLLRLRSELEILEGTSC